MLSSTQRAPDRAFVDLTAADFELLDDGKPAPIDRVRVLGAAAYAGDPTLAPIRTHEDEEHEPSRDACASTPSCSTTITWRIGELRVIEPLLAFVRQPPPTDLVAVYYPLDSVTDVAFSRDRDVAIKAILAVTVRSSAHVRRVRAHRIPGVQAGRAQRLDPPVAGARVAGGPGRVDMLADSLRPDADEPAEGRRRVIMPRPVDSDSAPLLGGPDDRPGARPSRGRAGQPPRVPPRRHACVRAPIARTPAVSGRLQDRRGQPLTDLQVTPAQRRPTCGWPWEIWAQAIPSSS